MSNQMIKAVALETVENGGSVSQAMKTVGYGPGYAHNPQKLTRTKTWLKLMDRYLPDDLLLRKHEELLNVPKIKRTFVKGEVTHEEEELDSTAIGKGLDMAYKLKGKYAPVEIEHMWAQFDSMSEEQLMAIATGQEVIEAEITEEEEQADNGQSDTDRQTNSPEDSSVQKEV